MDLLDRQLRDDSALIDALHGSLLDLREEVGRERDHAVETMAGWAGVRPSTMYDWIEGRYPPKKWQQVARLSINSTRAGFTSFGRFLIDSGIRFGSLGEVATDGNLHRERRDSDIIWADLHRSDEANDGDEIMRLGQSLHLVADQVIEEGRRRKAERLRRTA